MTGIDVANMVARLRGQTAIPNRNEVADMMEALAAALDEIRRQERANGMREAAKAVELGMTATQIERSILARADEIDNGATE